ncbi:hypothetical protein EVAR_98261_1 [Eumeta japonica]|uniref:Uncharacterized protein n=1 Tax=Eumeta variegata TaxID=151549 RepID=A0A4C2A2U9_EUMVA|nr:hypothetical protein EVAR_98261_1 [Eumeta japonica]
MLPRRFWTVLVSRQPVEMLDTQRAVDADPGTALVSAALTQPSTTSAALTRLPAFGSHTPAMSDFSSHLTAPTRHSPAAPPVGP